ncbi:MAG TPA: hypothetical protein PKH24_02075 [Sedimentisphaerales bacterium]|jgi:hypothetical protein|nr:hypothetical protein [Sedimentisphaerales bacterium]HNU28206.1 hypothetical protein [Sedimentisphaerales bacterium]
MKKALFAVAAVALLAVSVQAGEIKTHSWPCTLTPVEICTIPVVMDVGYWVSITNQNAKITLSQVSIHEYKGCATLKVKTNTQVQLSATITKNGTVGGNYSTWIEGDSVVPMGSKDVQVCAKITDADLSGVAGGSKGVQVATVTIWVVPTS